MEQKIIQWYDTNTKELERVMKSDKYYIRSIQTIALRMKNDNHHLTMSTALLSPKGVRDERNDTAE